MCTWVCVVVGVCGFSCGLLVREIVYGRVCFVCECVWCACVPCVIVCGCVWRYGLLCVRVGGVVRCCVVLRAVVVVGVVVAALVVVDVVVVVWWCECVSGVCGCIDVSCTVVWLCARPGANVVRRYVNACGWVWLCVVVVVGSVVLCSCV